MCSTYNNPNHTNKKVNPTKLPIINWSIFFWTFKTLEMFVQEVVFI